MNTMAPRLEWVDTLKGISIVLVVFYHATLMLAALDFEVEELTYINRFLAPIRMPAFFFAAGLFARSAINKSWKDVFQHKVALYMYLFVLWSVIRYIYFGIVPNPNTPTEGHNIFWLLQSVIKPVSGAWFLWSLSIFFLATRALRGIPPLLVVVVASVLSAVTLSDVLRLHFSYENTLQYFIFFYSACQYREIFQTITERKWSSVILGAVVFLLVTAAALISRRWWVDGAALFIAAWSGVFVMAGIAQFITGTRLAKSFIYIGLNTLPIYVIHVMIVATIAHVADISGVPDEGDGVLIFPLISTLLAIPICLLLFKIATYAQQSWWLFKLPFAQRVEAIAR
ncbi:acyltransferase family protein [Agrobacterium sp. AGB01]|uniref:acyltransferase family protein n=1 Tax=Agrobacterium sp. AGB01 TaxID=2769302 RepID=UPI00177E8935|nr:acyltransferase family protein [Agrobacterium sp. AGB01]MBD9390674.1 acyltransferase family protein [Agrobacterium sp. AGB01]